VTISDGSAITAADLNALTTTDLARLQDDNALVPLGFYYNASFKNLVTGTNALYRRARFVVPCDCYVEAMALQASEFTAASTITAAVTGDGALTNWPITLTGTVGAGRTNVTRLLYDNTKTKVRASGGGFATTSQAFRVFPRGSTITVALSTTSTATPSAAFVSLVMRQFFQRE
jgi:hypothetical protein